MGKKVQPKDTLGILEAIVEKQSSNLGDRSPISKSSIGKDSFGYE